MSAHALSPLPVRVHPLLPLPMCAQALPSLVSHSLLKYPREPPLRMASLINPGQLEGNS